MAKVKAPVESPESVVLRILEAIAGAPDGELKLLGKDEPAPLLASKAGPNKVVYEQLTTTGVIVTRTENKKDYAKLTALGFEKVAAKLTPEILGPAASRVADQLPLSERVEFLNGIVRQNPAASADLSVLLEETIAAEAMEQAARLAAKAKIVAQEEVTRKGLIEWQRLLDVRRAARIEAMKKEFALEGQTVDVPNQDVKSRTTPTPLPPAATEDEKDFRRQVARRLVSSWLEAVDGGKAEAREFLEAAIWNIDGLRQIGEPDEATKFDGLYHEGIADVFTGDAVKIARFGWILDEADDKEYVVLKAAVTK